MQLIISKKIHMKSKSKQVKNTTKSNFVMENMTKRFNWNSKRRFSS